MTHPSLWRDAGIVLLESVVIARKAHWTAQQRLFVTRQDHRCYCYNDLQGGVPAWMTLVFKNASWHQSLGQQESR